MKKLFLAMVAVIVTATALSAQENGKKHPIAVPAVQTDKDGGYDGSSATNCGIKFNIRLSGVTKVELESVDGNPLAGTARMDEDADTVETIEHASSVVTFRAADGSGFTPARITTSPPCLATSTEATGFPSTATALWLTISACIRPWSRERL